MLNALLGRKVGMTQVFGPNGTAIPVTVIEVGPCIVTQIKTVANDGYEAVQIGFEQTTNKMTRPALGHLGHSLPLLKAQRNACKPTSRENAQRRRQILQQPRGQQPRKKRYRRRRASKLQRLLRFRKIASAVQAQS